MKSIVKILFVGILMLVAAVAINAGDMLFQDGGLNVSQDLRVSTNVLYINSASGLVGIGTTTPGQKLDVAGTVQMTGFKLTTAPTSGYVLTSDAAGVGTWQAASGGGAGGWTDDGTVVRLTTITDNVGIGTTAPDANLHIKTTAVDSQSSLRLENDARNWILFTHGADADKFKIRDSTALADRLIIDASGNVGIGTTSPTRTLHVSGNANITGNLAYGTLSQNSPNLIWTEKAFVTCAKAIDGRWYVEYVDANLNTVREWVNNTNTAWQHRECYEKIQTTSYYFSLSLNESSMPKPENLYFDWNVMQVHERQPVNQTI